MLDNIFLSSTRILGEFPVKKTYYQPRSELREKIVEYLTRPEHTVALSGPTGSGKTSEALAFIYGQAKYIDNYNLVIWINCRNYKKECDEINRSLGNISNLYTYLAQYIGKWLLILDNALAGDFESLPNTQNGHIIITSSEDAWPNLISVSKFNREESRRLIQRIINRSFEIPKTLKRVTQIADELDDYPQALAEAAKEIVSKNISLKAYRSSLIEQRSFFYYNGYQPFPEGFRKKIVEIISAIKENDSKCYHLLCYLSHLDSVYIPRKLIKALVKDDPFFQEGDIERTNKSLNLILLRLKQYGLLEFVTAFREYYFSAPTLNMIRFYFSTYEESEYRNTLWDTLKNLQNFLKIKSKPNKPRFYFMHTRTLMDRILGFSLNHKKNPSAKHVFFSYEARKKEDIPQAINNLLEHSIAKKNSLGKYLLSDDNLISISNTLLSLVIDLMEHDELDAADFYGEILQGVLEKKFVFLSKENCVSSDLPSILQINWEKHHEKFILYQKVLFTNGKIQSHRTLEPDIQKFIYNFEMINCSNHLAFHIIKNHVAPDSLCLPGVTPEDMFYRLHFWLYTCVKKTPCTISAPLFAELGINIIEDKDTIKIKHSDSSQQYDLIVFDRQKKQLMFTGLGLGSLRFSSPILINFTNDRNTRLMTFCFLVAFLKKQQAKYQRYRFHRHVRLEKVRKEHNIKKIFTRDLLDDSQECYDLDKVLKFLLDEKELSITFDTEYESKIQAFRYHFIKLKRFARWRHPRFTEEHLKKDVEVKKQLDELIKELLSLIPKTFESAPKTIPFYEAIQAYEEGINFFQKNFDHTFQNKLNSSNLPPLLYHYRKLGKYCIDQYKAYKEQGVKDKTTLGQTLQKAWEYYHLAKKSYFEVYQHDEPIYEGVVIYIGLLILIRDFIREFGEKGFKQLKLEPEASIDMRKDYFLSCRFLLSQLYDATVHHVKKLSHIAYKINILPKSISSNHSIFDLFVAPSYQYYEVKLKEEDDYISKEPTHSLRRVMQANIMLSLNMYKEAIERYTKLLELYPYSSEILAQRALAEHKLGNYIVAEVDFKNAQKYQGNHNNLIIIYLNYNKQKLMIQAMDIRPVLPKASNTAIFKDLLKQRFAIKLSSMLEKARGEDNRLIKSEVTGRVIKALSDFLPTSASGFGFSANLPIKETIHGVVDTYIDTRKTEIEYSTKKVDRNYKIDPKDIAQLKLLDGVATELSDIFQVYIQNMAYSGLLHFSDYLAESMLNYLGSDRVIPYLAIEKQLISGAMEGNLHGRFIQKAGKFFPFFNSWNSRKIVKYADIRTPDGVFFKHPSKRYPYLYQIATEEDARIRGYKEAAGPSSKTL